MINIKMRCIEINPLLNSITGAGWININMRCIEIGIFFGHQYIRIRININMRCIEIHNVHAIFAVLH